MTYKELLPDKMDQQAANQMIDRIKKKKAGMHLMAEEIVELQFLLNACGYSTMAPETKPADVKNSH